MQYEEYCYHGTQEENANIIMKSKSFKISEKEIDNIYLGSGVYFMEKDELAAYNYCKKVNLVPEENIKIIKVIINSDNILDLGMTKDFDLFLRFKDILKKKAQSEGKPFKKFNNGVVFDYINRTNPFDLIRTPFIINQNFVQENIAKKNENLFRVNTYVCVRNLKCIKILEVI